ncbi:Protein CBG16280 [Caenorhabditis briggsae]|uniref:HMG box domain-containing protein n=3 Tax=Caenorhabditis briggsae TaxID=6238 RepID=A0AAE9JNF7_CAEBR|nr:Protein CBG16280 [Caenorhabditis briggsae]ULT79812.1 hypothetical protein L3Y34_010415 [Caenorhabditis briggsae]UMM39119.1 hypothetical protein L5515_016312 [Caenorhabditis briggsae]CAP34154.2 Protein CBG16280 [Caenorhabditis briggsae]
MSDRQPGPSSSGYQEDEESKSRKKHWKKAKPSADHVKRPMNPFMIWCQKKRGEMLKSQKGTRPAEISKLLGEGWRLLSDVDKQPYVEEAERLKMDHERNSHVRRKSPDHVKRPMNPFMIWCRSKRGEMLKTQPGMKPSEISKQLGEGWRNMSDDEKRPFVDEAERLKMDHERNHPDYKYKPQKKQKRERKPINDMSTSSESLATMFSTTPSIIPPALQVFYPNFQGVPTQTFSTSSSGNFGNSNNPGTSRGQDSRFGFH